MIKRGILGLFICLLASLSWGADQDYIGANQGADWEDKAVQLNIMNSKFGAKGDGSTDDQAAIQKTIDSASARGGGIVYFPPSSGYLINAPCSLASNVYLWGSGLESRILKHADSTFSFFVNKDSSTTDSNIILLNLYLDGQQGYADYAAVTSAAAGDAIALYNMKNVRVVNCWIYNAARDGIGIRNSENVEVGGCHIVNMGEEGITVNGSGGNHSIHDNTIIGQQESFEDGSGQKGGGILCKAFDTRICGNYIKYTGCGIDLNAEDGVIPYNITVRGNQIDSASGSGVAAIGVTNCLIDGNSLTHVKGYGIFVSRWQSSDTHSVNITISDNQIDSTGGNHSGYSRAGRGIYVEYGRGHNIITNKVNNYDSAGIHLVSIKESQIFGNIINNGDTAIKGYEADSCDFVLNRGYGNDVGIDLSNSSDYCVFAFNGFPDATTEFSRITATALPYLYGLDSVAATRDYVDGTNKDSFFVAESLATSTGWKQTGDTIFIDTSGGGAGTTNADSLRGVLIQTGSPSDDQMLRYDDISGEWKYENVPGSGSGDDVYYRLLGGGSDVDITDPTIMADSVTGDSIWPYTGPLGKTIETGEITDGTIGESDLNVDNSPTADDILSPGSGGDFTWKSILELGIPGDSTALFRSDRSDTTDYDIHLNGAIYTNSDAGSRYSRIYCYENGSNTGAYFNYDTLDNRFNVSLDLGILGDDIYTTTTSAGNLFIDDGTKFSPTAMSGDATINGSGVISLGADCVAGAEITNQSIKGDDVDSTSENFVFDDAFHVTSAEADSAYITANTLNDTADVVRAEIEDSVVVTVDTMTTLDSTNMVDHGLGLNNLAQEGATTGQVIKWDGSDWNPANDASGGTSDTSLYLSLAGSDTICVKWSANGDSLIFVDSGGHRMLFYYDDGWTFDGGGGLTIFDSALVDSILYFVSVGATPDDTTWITNVFLDSVRAGAFGGGGSGWDWADSTGMVVGWGGVAVSVVNDTIYLRFEGSSDFDTTGGSVSLADNSVASAEVDNQSLIYDDIDTTTTFVFGDAYHVTSATEDSAYLTKYTYDTLVDGSLDSLMGEAADAFSAIDHDHDGTYETVTNVGKIGDDTTTWNGVAVLFDTSYIYLNVDSILQVDTILISGDYIIDFAGTGLSVTAGVLGITAAYLDGVMDTGDVADADNATNADDVDTTGTKIAAALADRLRKDGSDQITGTLTISGGDLLVATANNIMLGLVNWNDGDSLNGDAIKDGSIDASELADDIIGAGEMADADHGDVAWSGGTATVQAVDGEGMELSGGGNGDIIIYDGIGDNRYEVKTVSGDISLAGNGVASIGAGVIVGADLSTNLHDSLVNGATAYESAHTRSHTMTSTDDHSATAHRTFYSDGSGHVQELAHGTAGKVLTANGATLAPSWQNVSTPTYEMLTVYGPVWAQGGVYQNNIGWEWDFSRYEPWAILPDSTLDIDTTWHDTVAHSYLGGDSLDNQFIHWAFAEFARGIGADVDEIVRGVNPGDSLDTLYATADSPKWRFAGNATLYRYAAGGDEDPWAFVSNDKQNWVVSYAVGIDSTPTPHTDTVWSFTPFFDSTDFSNGSTYILSHSADVDLVIDEATGDIVTTFLSKNLGSSSDKTFIIGCPSSNHVDYKVDDTVHICIASPANNVQEFLCPQFLQRNYLGDYELYYVKQPSILSHPDSSILIRLTHDTLLCNWMDHDGDTAATIDTVDITAPNDSTCIWHFYICPDPFNARGRILIATLSDNDSGNGPYGLHLYYSNDMGLSFDYINEIFEAGSGDFTKLYQTAIQMVYDGWNWRLDALITSCDASSGAGEWHTSYGQIHFDIIDTSRTWAQLWNPDLLTDTLPIFYADSSDYPNGVEIVGLDCQTSEDGAYALKFFIFTAADPPVLHDYIDTLNVGASDQRASSITFEDDDAKTVDVGQSIYILTPDTDIDWVDYTIKYIRKPK